MAFTSRASTLPLRAAVALILAILGLQAAAKPIETLSLTELDLAAGDVGEAGSASRVRRMYMPDKGRAELISGDVAQQAQRLAEIIREFKGAAS